MEAFLAIASRNAKHNNSLDELLDAGLSRIECSNEGLTKFIRKGVAFAIKRRSFASDAHAWEDDLGIGYFYGWSRPLDTPGRRNTLRALDKTKWLPEGRNLSTEVRLLSGSFHAVHFASASNELTAVVDRVGSRPLYYYLDADLLIVSSDLRLILSVPVVRRDLYVDGLIQFIRFQSILQERTLYKHVRTIPYASSFKLDARHEVVVRRYWSLQPLDPFPDDQHAAQAIANAFLAAGKEILNVDGKKGMLLSGGADSRIAYAALTSTGNPMPAYTFGPGMTDESAVAELVARETANTWRFVEQQASDYWYNLDNFLPALYMPYSMAHANTFKTAHLMSAVDDVETIFHGALMDPFFAGSYLPKQHMKIGGRAIFTYRLVELPTDVEAVTDAVCQSRDIQTGNFHYSFLHDIYYDNWHEATRNAYRELVLAATENWSDPLDWFEKALIGRGFARFYTYPVTAAIRLVARERGLIYDARVLDLYLRLSVEQRFLGPAYRHALRLISPSLARLIYPNTGSSLYDHPYTQAIKMQTRQFFRANRERLKRLTDRIHPRIIEGKNYGSYPSSVQIAQLLYSDDLPVARQARQQLLRGFLVEAGLLNADRVRKLFSEPTSLNESQALTLLALVTVEMLFSAFPPEM